MAWTAPATYSVAEIVTAAKLNTHVRDNLDYLKGNAGTVAIAADIAPTGVAALRNDGSYQFTCERTTAVARKYGFAVSGSDGSFGLDDATAGARRMTIGVGGFIGFGGITTPNTVLDVAQTTGHMGFWANNAITAKQVILATGVVTRAVVGYHLAGSNDGALTSSGTPAWSPLALGGTVDLINSGGVDVLRVTLSAGGELSIARSAGAKTYTAACMIVWY